MVPDATLSAGSGDPAGAGRVFRKSACRDADRSGAFTVGFGSFERPRRLRIAPMLLAGVGTGASTFVGTIAGNSDLACPFVAGLRRPG
jgi:hypothetical protein